MQKLQFNIISRDDWAQLANKQFGYFYFVVDDVEVLDAGGDLYLGENLIGSGLTIEEIVEYFENPENEHTFPGLTVGDLVPRGETALEISERFGTHAMAEKRYIKSGESKVLTIGGVTFDSNNHSTVLKCGLNTGSYQEWTGSTNNWLYVNGFNQFNPTMYKQGTDYLFVFPCVKGVPGKYGNPELGQNNGYVVVGGLETFVGYSSELGLTPLQQSDFTELTGVRLEGQPQDDNHVYYMPPDVGWMCVGYSSQPTSTTNEDGSLKLTLNGTEVGCHLAMDNKMDDTAGGVYANTIVFNIAEKNGIAASESGPGAYDDVVFNSTGYTYTRRISLEDCGNLSWDNDGGVYDETSGNYIWTWYASVDDMKPDSAFAITGGHEEMFIGAYTNGNEIRILCYGDESSSWNYPDECSMLYESADPEITTVDNENGYQDFYASKYGVVSVMYSSRGDIDLTLEETGPYVKIEYQQSGGDQIWNAIAYQKEMAEVTAAALCDLDSRIDNLDVDFTPLQNQIDEISEVTSTALNNLNDRIGEFESMTIDLLDDIPIWEGTDNTGVLTFLANIDNSSIKLVKVGSPTTRSVQYSMDGVNWTPYSFGTKIDLESAGEYVKFRGSNSSFSASNANYYKFQMTGSISASGDVTSLLNNVGGDCALQTYCFAYLFDGCSSLTSAPDIPSTTLATYCYLYMFRGCTSLMVAPELPATTMQNYCYSAMFKDCRNLTIVPDLPATDLADHCYGSMFINCTSLVNAPALPATTLAQYCYYFMFQGCTSLTTAPELPAKTLVSYCYQSMFSDCSSLNYIKALFTTTPGNNYTPSWVSGVSPTGTFIMNGEAQWDVTGVNGVPTGWNVNTQQELKFTAVGAGSTIKLQKNGDAPDLVLEYSTDGGTNWSSYTIGDTITLASVGNGVKFRGVNSATAFSETNYNAFVMTGSISASGDVTSLLNGVGGDVNLTGRASCFSYLFKDCSSMTTAPNLPSTILERLCYGRMFTNCSGITQAPTLPAKKICELSYYLMFSGCSSLTQAPELPAKELGNRCYEFMFWNCTSLTQAPALPATTIISSCYYGMFQGCSSLTQAPELPALTVAISCYASMFQGCSSLTQAPELPAITLAVGCYKSMFRECTSLTQAPELPALTLIDNSYQTEGSGCYANMFRDCSNLNYVKALFTTTPTSGNGSATQNWLYGVASSGTFVKNVDATWTDRGVYAVPANWTIQTVASE